MDFPKPNANQSRPQVLMLVADPILDGLYRNRLNSPDFCLVWCETSDTWQTTISNFRYDLIVADLAFFQSDEMTHTLHRLRDTAPDTELIVFTESDDARIAIEAFRLGVSDYFLKPVNPETLLWSIGKVLQRQSLRTSSESLSTDLKLFNTLHLLSVAETESKMRLLAMKHLMELFQSESGVWIFPENTKDPFEYFDISRSEGEDKLSRFLKTNPGLIENSFSNNLTNHPELWAVGDAMWIPLRERWMGGTLLFDKVTPVDPTLLARVEFLIRELEVSLESHSRYVQARGLSFTDELTGLYNSRYLEVALAASIKRYELTQKGFSILFIDADRFKSVNDSHGHLVGSRLLVELAHLLRRSMRKEDHLFRYGGDEFIALLYDANLLEAQKTAERLRQIVEKQTFVIQKNKIQVTLSIGVSRFPDHSQDKSQVIAMADSAMYEGKKAGRNSVFLAK